MGSGPSELRKVPEDLPLSLPRTKGAQRDEVMDPEFHSCSEIQEHTEQPELSLEGGVCLLLRSWGGGGSEVTQLT